MKNHLGVLFLSYIQFVYSQFDQTLAEQFWYYNTASYCRQSKIESWSCGAPCSKSSSLTDISVFKNSTGSNAGFIAYSPSMDSIIIVFRGTVPWLVKDWIDDLDFIQTKYSYCDYQCKVHEGFYKSFVNVQEQMFENYVKLALMYPDSKLTLTGHSLGGAMATHARVLFWSLGIPVDYFYTFGSPRVGNSNFALWFGKEVHPESSARVTFSHDPVPHLPLDVMLFQHINTEIYYRHFHKSYIVCEDGDKEDKNCANKHLVDLNIMDHLSYMQFNTIEPILACQ